MLTPNEIRTKATRWWTSGEFLKAWLRGEDFFAGGRDVPQIGLVKPGETLRNLPKIAQEQEALKAGSKKAIGYGYQLGWERVVNRQIGENDFIVRIFFDSDADFLKFICQENAFRRFGQLRALLESRIPALAEWIHRQPLRVLDHADNWEGLLRVCAYFLENPRPNLYVRQLPIAVSTKFIQNYETILRDLLDFLLRETAVALGEKTF